jgi:hypothetical protein
MGKKAKRARTFLRKQSILGEKIDEAILRRYGLPVTEDNSVMQERVKKEVPLPVIEEEKADVATDTNFTAEIVEEMVKEVETMVEEINTIAPKPVLEKPKPKTRTMKRRSTVNKRTTNTRKKKVEKN